MRIGGITFPRPRTRRLGEQLVNDGLIDEQQLRQALELQRQSGGFLGQALVSLGFMNGSSLGRYLESATGFPFIDLEANPVDVAIARSVPESLARSKRILPVADTPAGITVAMADPLDLAVVDDLRMRLNKPILPSLALEDDLHAAINRTFDVRHKASVVLQELGEDGASQDMSVDELVDLAEDAPIVRLVNGIISGAINSGASDIHIEPHEMEVCVRYRLDGMLYDQMSIPRRHVAAVVSRLKIMAHLNIAERRRPQDGRFATRDDNTGEYDIRISIMPTIFGEKVVMRLLQKSSAYGNVEKLGFFPEQKVLFEQFIKRPYGMVLVTGPTGSGKSTTLYAALNRVNQRTVNINTVEDPIEYNLPGINQTQVNPRIGVTFANGLRTLVRQDPDVIMVGEIRDAETAEIAIQAALTGHLVFSTLHTNDAPGALVRLQNMGIEPFLISSAMIGVIGQRLLRTVCSDCKETMAASQAMLDAFGMTPRDGEPTILARGRGCPRCSGRGMRGRTAAYEVMPMSDPLREMVLRRCSGDQIRGQAISEGMIPMRESGMRKVMAGVTTPEEIARVLFSEEF